MIHWFVPNALARWVRWRLTGLIEPHALLKYRPHPRDALSYMVPARSTPPPDSCPQGLPIPPPSLRMGYGTSAATYLAEGKKIVRTMRGIVRNAGADETTMRRILDFGCSSGRLIRWLKPLATQAEIWGVDITAHHIAWCKQHLSPPFYFALTTTMPHLPFEDGFFDLIYAGSVFTHFDDLTDAWFLELRRILRPGGLLYVTIHDNNTIRLLEGEYRDWPLASVLKNPQFVRHRATEFGMLSIGSRTTPQVFYDREYFERLMARLFAIRSYTENAFYYQSAVLLEKP